MERFLSAVSYGKMAVIEVNMRTTQKKVLLFVSCLFALLILVQHHYVNFYFDDYGYASLSYAGFDNQAGMQYGLNDILRFLKFHYFFSSKLLSSA